MPTVIIGDNSTGMDYPGTEDTQVHEGSPTTVHGLQSTIEIGKYGAGDHRHSLVTFSGISNLPSSLTVSSAVLSIYLTAANNAVTDVTVKKLLRDWVENAATWNVWKFSSSWTTSGGLSDGNDRSSTVSDTGSISDTTGQYYNFDDAAQIQADVEDFADGTLSNYGWHFERTDAANDTTYRVFTSSEGTDGQRPYLTVVYTTGAATDLTIQDASHNHTADNIVLTQTHILAIADAVHSHAADNLVLSVAIDLVIADSTHSHTVENVVLTQDHQLLINDALHSHSADNLDLTQNHILIVDDALHALISDNVTLGIPTGVITPSERVYIVKSENRVYIVAKDDRIYTILDEDRTYPIH